MNCVNLKDNNNKGFSLVELIVVIAIMVIAVGTLTLSVSLVTGSESKKAFQKLGSLIDETRTGSMSRYGQNLIVSYHDKDSDYVGSVASGRYDANGFYGEMKMYTLQPEIMTGDDASNPRHPSVKEKEITNTEVRQLCNDNVEIAVVCASASAEVPYSIGTDGTSYIKFNFDRSTGLYDSIEVKDMSGSLKTINYDKVTRTFKDGTNDVDVYITAKSGLRTYRMQLIGETGKHVRIE